MLLEFKIKNYKSFAKETIFSMKPAPKQSGLDYSLLPKKVGRKTIKGLCSSVIYGPNAAGKTNIIGALEVLKSIIQNGDIRNPDKPSSPNAATFLLETIPNNQLAEPHPVEFEIEFIEDGLLISYTLVIDLGGFLSKSYKRKIKSEVLKVNDKEVFNRGGLVNIGDLGIIKKYTPISLDNAEQIANNALHPEELFLTNGFMLNFARKFVEVILEWFDQKLVLIYRADKLQTYSIFENADNGLYMPEPMEKAIRLFGANSNSIAYRVSDDDFNGKLFSLFDSANLPAAMFESYGTIRFINLLPFILGAISQGGILVIDEFDASIHPMALMSIINIFHNDDINEKCAQLIFNTHNPIFLNERLFRRDEIKFVERSDYPYYSTLYSLSDFKTSGKNGVRKGEDYLKNYFINKYGAINDIDFTPIFEELLGKASETEV